MRTTLFTLLVARCRYMISSNVHVCVLGNFPLMYSRLNIIACLSWQTCVLILYGEGERGWFPCWWLLLNMEILIQGIYSDSKIYWTGRVQPMLGREASVKKGYVSGCGLTIMKTRKEDDRLCPVTNEFKQSMKCHCTLMVLVKLRIRSPCCAY